MSMWNSWNHHAFSSVNVKKSSRVSYKVSHKPNLWPSYSTCSNLSKKNRNISPQKSNSCVFMTSSFIIAKCYKYLSKLECINHVIIYSYNEILLSNKNVWIMHAGSNMNKPCINMNKPEESIMLKKIHTQKESIYIKFKNRQN